MDKLLIRNITRFTIVALFIVLWQGYLFQHPQHISKTFALQGASAGMLPGWDRFEYFYYVFGTFPVATQERIKDDSQAGAEHLLQKHGHLLVNELGPFLIRSGNLGKIWPLHFHALLQGSPHAVSVRPFHASLFCLALLAMWGAFCYVDRVRLGVISILFVGSNPFQIFEVYARENIFSLTISVSLLVFAAALPIIEKKATRTYLSLVALACGIFLATMGHIRSEAILSGAGLALAIALSRASLPSRVIALVILGSSFTLSSKAWTRYFDHKFHEAQAFVATHGGTPYTWFRMPHHMVYHTLFVGLSDFDERYFTDAYQIKRCMLSQMTREACEFRDEMGLRFAEKHIPDLPVIGRDYFDARKLYTKNPYFEATYLELMKKTFLTAVSHDPWWYGTILSQRIGKALHNLTPIEIHGMRGTILSFRPPLALYGFVLFCLFVFVRRERSLTFQLLAFFAPLSALAIIIYSGKGNSYYQIAHLFVAALCLDQLLNLILRRG